MGRLSEVQLLVLLSFLLQLFLFFTGGLRRRSRHWLLRSTIWIAYLGADVVAIYALGLLSRQADAVAHPLAFLWAPFLLIHLGGQDTITAYAIEDNNLWLRHLLNLLLQVTLALYVFWKSSSWHSTQVVLVPGLLLFVAGIIKYGERTAALSHGNLNSTAVLLSTRKSTTTTTNNSTSSSSTWNNNNNNNNNSGDDDGHPFGSAVRSAPGIRMLFARRRTLKVAMELVISRRSYSPDDLFKLMDVELGMMYSDLYTKAAVLRTKTGIVFRCISLACTVAALVLFFFFTSTNTYTTGGRSADTVVTYTLFIGGLVMDMWSVLKMVTAASPWTWAWLRARGHRRIARMVLVSRCWLGTRRPLWSNTIGQYRFVCYDDYDSWQRTPLKERVMGIIRKVKSSEEQKELFGLSKLLETEHVVVGGNVTKCLVEEINGMLLQSSSNGDHHQQQWPCLGQLLLLVTQPECTSDFVRLVSWLHACTEVLLREAAAATAGGINTNADADFCRKVSRYMMYLVAVHPAGASLLQIVSSDPGQEYRNWERYSNISLSGKDHQICMGLLRLELEAANKGCGCASSSSSSSANTNTNPNRVGWGGWHCCGYCGFSLSPSRMLASSLPRPEEWARTLEELKRMWAGLLAFAAGKSRPEAHAAELARGGELLTFVWLLLCHKGLGADFQLDLVVPPSSEKKHDVAESGSSKTYYVFSNLPAVQMVVNNCCPQLLLPPPPPVPPQE